MREAAKLSLPDLCHGVSLFGHVTSNDVQKVSCEGGWFEEPDQPEVSLAESSERLVSVIDACWNWCGCPYAPSLEFHRPRGLRLPLGHLSQLLAAIRFLRGSALPFWLYHDPSGGQGKVDQRSDFSTPPSRRGGLSTGEVMQ